MNLVRRKIVFIFRTSTATHHEICKPPARKMIYFIMLLDHIQYFQYDTDADVPQKQRTIIT